MLHKHHIAHDDAKPHLQTCGRCHHPFVLIDYHEKLLKGCISCDPGEKEVDPTFFDRPAEDVAHDLIGCRLHCRVGDNSISRQGSAIPNKALKRVVNILSNLRNEGPSTSVVGSRHSGGKSL
jgi:hypothetical protein